MSSLVKNELTKIFKKKSIYITLLVILAFVILTNCIYKYFYNGTSSYYYSDDYIEYTKEELAKLDPNKPSDTKMYIELKTQLDISEMMQKYGNDSWQSQIISTQMSMYISERNTYLYGEGKDEAKAEEMNNKIDDYMKKLDNGDWKYFADEELKRLEEQVKNLEEAKKNTDDKQELENIETEMANCKIDLEVAKYRVEKDIKYGNDYRNMALDRYSNASKSIQQIDRSKKELSYAEKQDYNTNIEDREVSKYIIENNVDAEKGNDLRGILSRFFSEYGLFIIVMVIMIAGTIVSEEFNKGTIKLLLVKPYNRNKILLSKFITVLIMIAFSIVTIVGMEMIVGGIFFGYDSLSVPILQYNFNTNQLQEINVLSYLGMQILTQLPIIILLATLAFAFSTIFTNSAVSIALPLLGYMGAEVINVLAVQYNVEFIKYFVTMNWNFSTYLFGDLPMMEGLTAGFSAVICLVYFLIMMIPTFIIFKKKNIKNI